MEEAKDYKKYLKGLKEATTKKTGRKKSIEDIIRFKKGNIQGLLAGRSLLKRNKGGAMLKNPGKADLDKDGKLSGYEKKRGMAIEANMKAARGKAVNRREDIRKKQNPISEYDKKGKLKYTAAKMGKSIRGYGAARTSGMGLQDEAMKPGKVMNANKGMYLKSEKVKEVFPDKSPSARARIQQMVGGDRTAPMKRERMYAGAKARRRKFFDKLRKVAKTAGSKMPGAISVEEAKRIKKILPEKMNKGGESKGKGLSARGSLLKDKRRRKVEEVMKRMKAPRTINIKNKFTSGTSNPMQRDRKREGYRAKVESAGGKVMFADERGMKKFKNFMGGGMMKPMGYKKGSSIMARGCKLGRKKATKLS